MSTENAQTRGHDSHTIVPDGRVLSVAVEANGIAAVQIWRGTKNIVFRDVHKDILGPELEKLDDCVLCLEAGNPDDVTSEQLEFVSALRICYDRTRDRIRIINISEISLADPRLDRLLAKVAAKATSFASALVGIITALRATVYTFDRMPMGQLVFHDW